jgi:hypothetical protein
VETQTWEWSFERLYYEGGFYDRWVLLPLEEGDQPPINPGTTVSWTIVVSGLDPWEWVRAVEFEAWGETYRFNFPQPSPGEYGYVDCDN